MSLSSPERFDKAAGELFAVWDQEDPPDPEVAGNLAIALLNGDRRRYEPQLGAKAVELMNKSLELGGSASFLVNHAHDKLGVIQGGVRTNYCSGQLSIKSGRLHFISMFGDKAKEHSFELEPQQLRKVEMSRQMVRLEFADSTGKEKGYHLFPRTQLESDAKLMLTVIETVFRGKRK